jgi:hypothetical protein
MMKAAEVVGAEATMEMMQAIAKNLPTKEVRKW